MSTRHLTCVVKDSDYKVAQYGQGDGYYSGAGINALHFLRDELDREKFLANLAQAYEPNDEQIAEMNARIKAENKSVSALYPSLSRDTGSDIFGLIQNSNEPVPVQLSIKFAADSLFCEYAYVVDFDKGTFEVFKGYNTSPLIEGERFYGAKGEDQDNRYFPVRHVKTYQLDALPSDEQFLADLDPQEEE